MMGLTRDFRETIAARARRDPRFREALLTEAINAYLFGDTAEGKAILRDFVNATVGFEGLAAEIGKPSKSLHRMLAPRGNPSTENFFRIVSALQEKTRVRLRVTAGARSDRELARRVTFVAEPVAAYRIKTAAKAARTAGKRGSTRGALRKI